MYRVGYESVEEPLKNLRVLYQILEMKPDKDEEEKSVFHWLFSMDLLFLRHKTTK